MALPGIADDELDDDLLDDAPDGEPSIEERARAKGWKPLEELPDGFDKRRWRSAEEFIRIGEHDSRVLLEENRRLTKRVLRMEGQMTALQNTSAEQLDALKEMRELAKKADTRGYQRALQELKEQRREAVTTGDTTAFDQIEEQINVLENERAPPPPAPPPPTPKTPPKIDPEIQEFVEANPWYLADKTLNKAMIAFFDIIEQAHPALSLTDKLERAKARVAKEYPAKFGLPAADAELEEEDEVPAPTRRPAAPVARPGNAPVPRQRGAAGWEQITDPDERRQAKGAFERQARADPGLTESEYLQIYLDPRIDALALRRARPAK